MGHEAVHTTGDPERSPVDHSRRVVATSSADTVFTPTAARPVPSRSSVEGSGMDGQPAVSTAARTQHAEF